MRILVFQHLAVEHPGVFRELWSSTGHDFDQIELDEGDCIPDLDPYDLMVVMGGPMDVWQEDIHGWLAPEKAAIRKWVRDLRRPYLGICLGHQLLAAALGGNVTLMAKPEVGLAEVELSDAGKRDALLRGFDSVVETFQWHGAEVSILPAGAEVLASNAACRVQAMRWGRHAYGFQYHCEITGSTVEDWRGISEYKASLEAAIGIEGASTLESKVAARLPAFRRSAELLTTNLFSLISVTRETA